MWCIFSGKIACANVVSDLYAMGVTKIDNVLMLLAVSTKMTENEQFVISKLIIDGFKVSLNSFYLPKPNVFLL